MRIFFMFGPIVGAALMFSAWKIFERFGPEDIDGHNVASVVATGIGYAGLTLLLLTGFAFSLWGEPW